MPFLFIYNAFNLKISPSLFRLSAVFAFFLLFFSYTNLAAQQNRKIDSLENKLRTYTKPDSNQVNLLTDLARRYIGTNNQAKSLEYAERAFLLAEKVNFISGLHDALAVQGLLYSNQGQTEKALGFYSRAYQLINNTNDRERKVATKLNLASAYAGLSRYAEALIEAQNALTVAKQASTKQAKIMQAYALNTISNIQIKLGNYEKAVENLLAALTIAEENADATAKLVNYQSLALSHSRLENHEKAAQYAEMAIASAKNANDKRRLGRTYLILAKANSKLKKSEECLKSLRLGMDIATSIKDEISVASALSSIGGEYIIVNQPDSAKLYLNKALIAANRINDKQLISIVQSQLAEYYTQQAARATSLSKAGYVDAGLLAANEAFATAVTAGLPEEKKIALLRLSEIHLQKDEYVIALDFFKRYKSLNDSILNLQRTDQLVKMQAQFDTESKSRELVLLNQEMQLKESELDKANLLAAQIRLASENEKERNRFLLAENELNAVEIEKQWALQRKIEADNLTKLKENELLKKEKALQNAVIQNQQEQNKLQLVLIAAGLGLLLLFASILFVLFKANSQKKRSNELLQAKNSEINEQNAAINEQKLIIEKKNHAITSSINYAKRIQTAILPQTKDIEELLPEHFILMKPRDIVSGDFYLVSKYFDTVLIAAIDCTGHGVPGAFMSLIANDLMSLVMRRSHKQTPDEILTNLHLELRNSLHKNETHNKEGMDIALCLHEPAKRKLEYAGAHLSLYWIFEGICHELKADAHAIGEKAETLAFTLQTITLEKGSMVYLFSDGYRDQFGGTQNRRFLSKRFKETLTQASSLPMQAQKDALDSVLLSWMKEGNEKQTDDILVLGFRV
ncbi:MAG: hypothetical protein EAZ57_09740 [Cytophagales bacterium]|nr:MAG: hypothetical protein EAZ67_10250 [Cytophagales bacterium]TAF59817.1 MAG: hypothetical protein EAZ57_09740 [Cytophagales bacterium]